MMVIAERELQICCDASDCRCYARYIIRLNITTKGVTRLYCALHTAELLQKAVKVLRDGEQLSDYIETEHIDQGLKIEAT